MQKIRMKALREESISATSGGGSTQVAVTRRGRRVTPSSDMYLA